MKWLSMVPFIALVIAQLVGGACTPASEHHRLELIGYTPYYWASTGVEPPRRLAGVPPGEHLIVGRIEVSPRIRSERLRASSIAHGGLLVLVTNDPLKRCPAAPDQTSCHRYSVDADRHFWALSRSGSLWIVRAVLNIEHRHQHPYLNEQVLLGGVVAIAAPRGARAVYIGTLLYHRNAWGDILALEVVDEYEEALAAFRERYGEEHELVKSLAVVIEQPPPVPEAFAAPSRE